VTLIPLDGSTTVFSEYIGGGEAVLIAAAYTFYLVFFIVDEFINEPGKVSSPTVGPYAGEPGNLVLLSKKDGVPSGTKPVDTGSKWNTERARRCPITTVCRTMLRKHRISESAHLVAQFSLVLGKGGLCHSPHFRTELHFFWSLS
jgi:hypothetical protein